MATSLAYLGGKGTNMPTIVFSDGKRQEVNYSKGSRIKMILDGNREPEDEKQAKFIDTVVDVVFEPVQVSRPTEPQSHTSDGPDMFVRAMVKDQDLRGRDKFDAIGKYLKRKMNEDS